MDFHSPECIISALHDRVAHGVFGYSHDPKTFREIIVHRMAVRYGWLIEPDWIIILPGIVSGLNISVRALTQPGEATLAPTPVYPPFRSASLLAGRLQRAIPMKEQHNRITLDVEAAEQLIEGNEKLLMLCNPHNPGGTVYTQNELLEQLYFAQRHNLIVCSDEIHCELLLDPDTRHIPFASLNNDAAQRSVTLISPSKTFNIAGLGASCAIIPDPELRLRFMQTRQGMVPSVDVLAITTAEAAWRDGDPWLASLLPYLRANRQQVLDALQSLPELRVISPQATYLAWIDASGLNMDNPTQFFLDAGVALSPESEFGNAQYVRLNFGCPAPQLTTILDRIEKAVRSRRLAAHAPDTSLATTSSIAQG